MFLIEYLILFERSQRIRKTKITARISFFCTQQMHQISEFFKKAKAFEKLKLVLILPKKWFYVEKVKNKGECRENWIQLSNL